MSGTGVATKKLTEPFLKPHSNAILKVRGYMQKKDTTMHAGSTNLLTYLNKEKTPKRNAATQLGHFELDSTCIQYFSKTGYPIIIPKQVNR